jgi:hypothetical protein
VADTTVLAIAERAADLITGRPDRWGQSVLDRRIVLSDYRPSGAPPYAS